MPNTNINYAGLTVGITNTGRSRLIAELGCRKQQSAFFDWDRKLKKNEQRPRGKFFKSQRLKQMRALCAVTLEDPVDLTMF